MKKRTNTMRRLSALGLLSTLVTTTMTLNTVIAQDNMHVELDKGCNAGFAGTWIIGNACDVGGNTNLKTDDAIVLQCDSVDGSWSVDFFEEPADADPNAPFAQAIQYALCPGNGKLDFNADGDMVLRCNFWEAVDNVTKQLEFSLQPDTEPNIRSISWLSRELNNPNMVCGVAGRPESGTDVGSGGQTTE